jgi:hypothetical protein
LRATDNRNFVVNGNQTNLEVNALQQEDSRFKNVNLVFPAHLEFDFTKHKIGMGKPIIKRMKVFVWSRRICGVNLKSKPLIMIVIPISLE